MEIPNVRRALSRRATCSLERPNPAQKIHDLYIPFAYEWLFVPRAARTLVRWWFNFAVTFRRTVDRLWSITEDLNILYKENWTRLAAHEVQQFQVRRRDWFSFNGRNLIITTNLRLLHSQDKLLRAVRSSKIHQTGVQPAVASHKWSYASAFLYSLTLITTIGKRINSRTS